MKVLLLGGSGDIGFNVVQHLSSIKEISRLVIADNNITLSQDKLKHVDLKKDVYVIHINLDEEQSRLATIMKKADYVINCIGPFYHYGLIAAKAAVEAGVNFMDICDEYRAMEDIFSLKDLVQEKNMFLLTGMGWSPGLTNLAVKKIAHHLTEIHRLQISICSNSASLKSLGMITHLLYCRREKPFYYRDNRLVEPEKPEEEKGIVEFLPPFGEIMVNNIIHPELLTLPQNLPNLKEMTVRGSIIPSWLNSFAHRLVQSPLFQSDKYLEGLASQFYRYQLLFGQRNRPFSALRIDVWGREDEEERHRVFQMIERKGDMVGISLSTALLMLTDGSQRAPGIYAPESCLDADVFFDKIKEHGLEVQVEEH